MTDSAIRLYTEETVNEEIKAALTIYYKADQNSALDIALSADSLADALCSALLMIAELKPKLSDEIHEFLSKRDPA